MTKPLESTLAKPTNCPTDGVHLFAVAEWVAEQPGIDKHRIGLFGLSQGGWIVPLAANKTELISYSVILSGPVASLGQEKLFSNLAGDEKRDSAKTLEEVDQAMEEFSGAHGFDSSEEIERMEIPSFWLFGENDRSMPVQISLRNLDRIIQEGDKTNFTYKVYPNADHSLYDVNTAARLDYITDIKNWVSRAFK